MPFARAAFEEFAGKMAEHDRSRSMALVNLDHVDFACTSSMFVNKASVAKYAACLAGHWTHGDPLDLFLRRLVKAGRLRAYVTVPFLTSISAASNESDIQGPLNASRRVTELYRRGFFLDADAKALVAEMLALTAGAQVSPLAALYLNAEMYSLSDKWMPF